jgi:PQQ-dependent catabolism-associated CXXCW motif protein
VRRTTHVRTGPTIGVAALTALVFAAIGSAKEASTSGAVAEPTGYWSGEINSPVPASIHGGKVIHVQALTKLVLAGNAVIIDVSSKPQRPENLSEDAWMPPPHRAIPGALWIPGVGGPDLNPALDKFFRERLAAETNNDFSRPVVIYCHERCWLSWNAAKRAISYGYMNVSWFPEGIEGWRATGMSTLDVAPAKTPDESAPGSPPAESPPPSNPSVA